MFVNQIRILVEYGHCGPAGIVYCPQFMRWFDACTTTLFSSAGLTLPRIFEEQGVLGIPIVNLETRFLLPSTCGDELLAQSKVSRWGRSSFVVHHLFSKGELPGIQQLLLRRYGSDISQVARKARRFLARAQDCWDIFAAFQAANPARGSGSDQSNQ